jgi:hypothetical protein
MRTPNRFIVDDPHDIGDDPQQIEGTIESFHGVAM